MCLPKNSERKISNCGHMRTHTHTHNIGLIHATLAGRNFTICPSTCLFTSCYCSIRREDLTSSQYCMQMYLTMQYTNRQICSFPHMELQIPEHSEMGPLAVGPAGWLCYPCLSQAWQVLFDFQYSPSW